MLIGLAVESWAAAHSGDRGTAWWIARGLLSSGHSVEVVTTESGVAPELNATTIKVLPARTPSRVERAMALRRAAGAAYALPSIQQDLLDRMGATSDLASFDPNRYDLLVGVGVRSPHVRGAMARAVGSTPTAIHLTAQDVPLCAMPLLRQSTLGHRLVTHWPELQTPLALSLRRDVSCVPPSQEGWIPLSDRPEVPDEAAVSGQSVVWAATRPLVSEQSGRDPTRVVVEPAILDSWRLDALVEGASAVVIGFEAGDLALVARRSNAPVVIVAGCPGAHWVEATGSGTVVSSASELPDAVAVVLRDPTVSPVHPTLPPFVSADAWARCYISR